MKNNFFRRASAEDAANFIHQLFLAEQKLIVGRQLHRVTERSPTARNDADFVHRIRVFAVSGDKRMADFMIGDTSFLLLVQSAALSFRAGDDFLDRLFQIMLVDRFAVPTRREQRRFVQRICQIRARKSGRGLRDFAKFDRAQQRNVAVREP